MPFSWIYRAIVRLRNMLFEWKILPSERFPLPVICVGNIAAGGAGKTPFTEYLIEILKENYRIATLSRGYKRKTKGFLIVNERHTPIEAGDEACQIKQKFPEVIVSVDENRRRGIKKLLSMAENEKPDVVILDDAMQHRYVSPSLTIMLTERSNICYEDTLLPAGNLREPVSGAYRSDMIVVTKCSPSLKPEERRSIEKNMTPMTTNRLLYFSTLKYYEMKALFPDKVSSPCRLSEITVDEELLLIAGIANPQPFMEKIKKYSNRVTEFIFPDHYSFKRSDIQRMDKIFQKMPANGKIICTEKDAMRLKSIGSLPESWKPRLYFLPTGIDFLYDKERDFRERIVKHVCFTINNIRKEKCQKPKYQHSESLD